MLESIRGRGVHELQIVADRLAELNEDPLCILRGKLIDRSRCCVDALSKIGTWALGKDERARLWAWAYSIIREHPRVGDPVEWGNIPHPDNMVPEANTWCGVNIARFFDYDCWRTKNDRVRAVVVFTRSDTLHLHYDRRGIWKPRELTDEDMSKEYAWQFFDLVTDYHRR